MRLAVEKGDFAERLSFFITQMRTSLRKLKPGVNAVRMKNADHG